MTAIHDGRCAASTSRKFLLDVSDRRVKKKGECGGSFITIFSTLNKKIYECTDHLK